MLLTIDIAALHSEAGLALVMEKFNQMEGFEVNAFVAKGEKRILESSESGIKVLASQLEFEPIPESILRQKGD